MFLSITVATHHAAWSNFLFGICCAMSLLFLNTHVNGLSISFQWLSCVHVVPLYLCLYIQKGLTECVRDSFSTLTQGPDLMLTTLEASIQRFLVHACQEQVLVPHQIIIIAEVHGCRWWWRYINCRSSC